MNSVLAAPKSVETAPATSTQTYRPKVATDFASAGLSGSAVEALVLKFLLGIGAATGRRIADELGLPFGLFPEFLRQLKSAQYLNYANTAAAGDYHYALTDHGRDRARNYFDECAYVGTAPVPYRDYLEGVEAQSITRERPNAEALRKAFEDLVLPDEMFRILGPAITSGRGFFLYGAPGNGKTSIAERVTKCFGTSVWMPRTLSIEGQVVKLFDPVNHEPVNPRRGGILRSDEQDDRWIEVQRPTIVAGGELTMDNLEINYDVLTKVCEAPLQMKSNNGTFLIDDFGRQRMHPTELLNRWIVPLEKRHDYLRMPSGKKVRMPFDQLILFSTNLEPKQLVDEAFLRRIPYKIEAPDPSEATFRAMIEMFAPKLGFDWIDPKAIDYLIQKHYHESNRPFRCCQPRDLLLQVRNYCLYNELPFEVLPEYLDFAAFVYFAVM